MGPSRAGKPELAPGPDAALVRRARSGDEEAFAAIYRTHRKAVLATCLKRLRDAELAEDAVQDTFLRAYSSLERFDERRSLQTWLCAIAARRCVDVQRRSSHVDENESAEANLPEELDLDPTLTAVIAIEERGRLERALRQINPRQRRALLLSALEGWTLADIAATEGVSVSSVKSMLFHARKNLRRACRRGAFGTMLLVLLALRRRFGHDAAAVRTRLASALEPLASSLVPVSSGFAAVVISLTATTAPSLAPVAGAPAKPTVSVAAPGAGFSGSRVTAAAVPRAQARGFARSLLNPTRDATPETTQFTSVTPSPHYEQDHTLVAAGRVSCPQNSCSVLFISRDGGATWERQDTRNFSGHTVLLPPSYPADPRIFAMGRSGLEASTDGTEFAVVLPVRGDAAISPLFDGTEPRILIGATVVTEYWADSETPKPATLIGPAGTWLTVAFSPLYADDHTVFVGGVRPDASGTLRPTVNRCAKEICESIVFKEGFDAPYIRPSEDLGRDQTVYAFTGHVLFRSTDRGVSYVPSSPAFAAQASIRDVLVADGSVLVAVQSSGDAGGGIFQSFDGGSGWTRNPIAIAGFEGGVTRIVGLPDGRLIALGVDRGIACSSDGGRRWVSRCS